MRWPTTHRHICTNKNQSFNRKCTYGCPFCILPIINSIHFSQSFSLSVFFFSFSFSFQFLLTSIGCVCATNSFDYWLHTAPWFTYMYIVRTYVKFYLLLLLHAIVEKKSYIIIIIIIAATNQNGGMKGETVSNGIAPPRVVYPFTAILNHHHLLFSFLLFLNFTIISHRNYSTPYTADASSTCSTLWTRVTICFFFTTFSKEKKEKY